MVCLGYTHLKYMKHQHPPGKGQREAGGQQSCGEAMELPQPGLKRAIFRARGENPSLLKFSREPLPLVLVSPANPSSPGTPQSFAGCSPDAARSFGFFTRSVGRGIGALGYLQAGRERGSSRVSP